MSKSPGGFGDVADPFGQVDADIQDRYIPPSNLASWEREPQQIVSTAPLNVAIEDDEPFTAAHLAAATQDTVPAVVPVASQTPAPPMVFPASVGASKEVTGRIGTLIPQVTRLGSSPEGASLLEPGAPSSAPIQGGGGGRGAGSAPPGPPIEDPGSYAFYNIKRYRTFFNVDTDEVLGRMFRAVAFFFRGDFFEHVGSTPDLYGPFWIASTLVFVSAAAGNTASYIAYHRSSSSTPPPAGGGHATGWYYDVDKVGGSMGLFYGYVGVVGLALWAILRWFQSRMSLAQVWCAYGYAMTGYIPMAALCVLPMEAVRWSVVGVATAISAMFLLLNFRGPIVEATGPRAVPLLLTLGGLHLGLGLALKLYFFHYSS